MDTQERSLLTMLQVLLEEREVTQRQLATRLVTLTGDAAWTQQKVWRVLHGRTELTVGMLMTLCHALDISVIEFMVRALIPSPHHNNHSGHLRIHFTQRG